MASQEFLHETKIECKDTGEICNGFLEYLNSEHWSEFRKNRIGKKSECAVCGNESDDIKLLHVSFKRLGNERPADVVALCGECYNRAREDKGFRDFLKAHKELYTGQETMAQHKKNQAKAKRRKRNKCRKMYHYATCPNSCHVRKVC